MNSWLKAGFLPALLLLAAPAFAQGANPEDEPILDQDVPAVPARPTPQTAAPQPEAPAETPAEQPAPADNGETVTIPRSQLDTLQRQQAELQRQIDELRGLIGQGGTTATTGMTGIGNTGSATDGTTGNGTAGTGSGSGSPAESEATSVGGSHALLLPDISFIGNARGVYSTDKRDEERSAFRLSEGELGIQGYVYPNVKADAFIVGAPSEDEAFQIEEGYLSFLGVRRGLNIYAGKKFAPFGRTGEQHNHSWLYTRQLIPRRNLIAEEALVGDGANFRYVLPTGGNLYAQADFGIFTGAGPADPALDENGNFDPGAPFGDGVARGTGVGFTRRFYNSRLYLAHPIGQDGELALGGSYARGRSEIGGLGRGNAAIQGLDLTFRKSFEGSKRFIARAEYFGYKPGDGLGTHSASGYYGLLNYRFEPRKDIGLLYERSGFPQAPGEHENALSLIYTKQLTEQFYTRLHATHGDRPGQGGYNEIFLQLVYGLGPHTHNLE